MPKRYDWPRFLVDRDGVIVLDDQDFLSDPTIDFGEITNPHAKAFSDLPDLPVMVLLGEPGIGKSTLLDEAALAAEKNGRKPISVSLGEYGSEDRLIRDFKEVWTAELTEKIQPIDLLIDNLDEGLLSIPHIARILGKSLQVFTDVPDLRLRLTCRSAVWPATFEERLRELWGQDRVGVYELAPLRRSDVQAALVAESLDPKPFLEEILHLGAGPLASRPVTLRFLIGLRQAGQALPTTRVELYHEGCTLLCDEANPDRRDAGRVGRLSPAQHLTVAARIAAVMVLAKREAVWIGAESDCERQNDVSLGEFVGRCLSSDRAPFDVSSDDVRETLDTGLFSTRGSSRIGFAHQTYAEFLTAWYLYQQRMPVKGKLTLLVGTSDVENGLVPQLAEVAAWSAAIDSRLVAPILELDPPILLQSDVAVFTPDLRRALVESLLELADRWEWSDADWGVRIHYRNLSHPGLAPQLQPWIKEKSRFRVARRVAIDIAEACGLGDLHDTLSTVALDVSDDRHIRSQAAYALTVVGDSEAKRRLRPLLYLKSDEDPDEDLKGNALRALWPDGLSALELFSCIGRPRQPSYFGIYQMFLSRELVPSLNVCDLPLALRWVREHAHSLDMNFSFEEIGSEIVLKAFKHLDNLPVRNELALTIWSRLGKHEDILTGARQRSRATPLDDDALRRKVLLAILPLIQNPDHDHPYLTSSISTPVLRPEDVPWLIELSQRSSYPTVRWVLGRLLDKVFSPIYINEVLDACGADDVLRRSLPNLCRPIFLNSRRAKAARESYRIRQRMQVNTASRLLDPPPREFVRVALEATEAGQLDQFMQLCRCLTLEPQSRRYEFPPLNLRSSPGWDEADSSIRERIVNTAFLYLRNGDPDLSTLLDTNSIPHACFAGLSALFLVESVEPELYRQLTTADWERWGPVVLARSGDADREELQESAERILRRAYFVAPNAMCAALRRMIERDRRIHSYVFVARHLDAIWDERIALILLRSAKAFRDFPRVFEPLFRPLLVHQTETAIHYAEILLGAYPSRPTREETENAVTVAGLLLQHAPETRWPQVWKVIERDRAFGKSLIRSLASGRQEGRGWLDRTSERDLGRLFVWMEREFPHGEDAKPDYSGASNARIGFMDLAEFRNTMLQGLAQRGTPAAVNAIQLVCAEFPEIPWFRYTLAGAREALRRDTWIPPSPGELLEVTSDFTKRLVRNDHELLELVVESLERMHDRFQGANLIGRSLWNECQDCRRPKDENFFSDVVRDHLEQDLKQRGIVAQREVEIRRLNPNAPVGERGDIVVTASSRSHQDEIGSARVVIESKGCWNAKLQSEMEDQLVKRYLIDEGYRCGLYLVGWFVCDAWNDPEDKRRKKVPSWTFEEASENLAAQARTLSQEGIEIRAFVLDGRLPRA